MGSILLINVTPSSFSVIMFIALKVHPMNMAVTRVITIGRDFKLSLPPDIF